MREPRPDQTQTIEVATTPPTTVPFFTVAGPWPEDGEIDARFTCAGQGISPAVTAVNVPEDVVSLGLVLVNTTARNETNWAVANLVPADPLVPEGTIPAGAVVAVNDFGAAGYEPPCAAAGERQEYLLMVYSFDQVLELPADATSDDLTAAFEAAALDVAMSAFTVTSP